MLFVLCQAIQAKIALPRYFFFNLGQEANSKISDTSFIFKLDSSIMARSGSEVRVLYRKDDTSSFARQVFQPPKFVESTPLFIESLSPSNYTNYPAFKSNYGVGEGCLSKINLPLEQEEVYIRGGEITLKTFNINSDHYVDLHTVRTNASLQFFFQVYRMERTDKDLIRVLLGQVTRALPSKYENCDSLIFVSTSKVFLVCWVYEPATSQLGLRLEIFNPVKNILELMDTTILTLGPEHAQLLDMINNQTLQLKVIPLRKQVFGIIEIAFYFRNAPFFYIIQINQNRFGDYIYPVSLDTLTVAPPKGSLPFSVARVEYLLESEFLFFSNDTPAGFEINQKIYYLNSASMASPQYLDKGIYFSFKSALSKDALPKVSEIMIGFSIATDLSGTTLSIRRLKMGEFKLFSDSEIFKVLLTGQLRQFRGFLCQDNILFIDSNRTCTPEGHFAYSFNVIVTGIKPSSSGYSLTTVQKLPSPSGIVKIFSSQHMNLFATRREERLDIFSIDDMEIDLVSLIKKLPDIPTNGYITARLFAAANSTAPDPPIGDYLQGVWAYIAKNESIFEIKQTTPVMESPHKINQLPPQEIQNLQTIPISMDDLTIGNYISHVPGANPGGVGPVVNFMDPLTLDFKETGKVFSIFSMVFENRHFLIVSFDLPAKNELYEFNIEANTYTNVLTIFDNRRITNIRVMTASELILNIEGLMYNLNLITMTCDPVFKSNDFCGDVQATFNHVELGKITVCGGKDEITLFPVNPLKGKIDLSYPIKSYSIDNVLKSSMKREGIMALVTTTEWTNRFALITKIIKEIEGSVSKFSLRIKVMEVLTTIESVELSTNGNYTLPLDREPLQANSFMVGRKLVMILKFNETLGTTFTEMRIFFITKTSVILLEKNVRLCTDVELTVDDLNMVDTYLPHSLGFIAPKLTFLAKMKRNSAEILNNFNFFDAINNEQKVSEVYKKSLLVVEPYHTSLNIMKVLDMPEGHDIMHIGPYYFDRDNTSQKGVVILSKLDNGRMVINFMTSHSMNIDFVNYEKIDSYLDKPRPNITSFKFNSYHYEQRKEVEASIDFKLVRNFTADLAILRPEIPINLNQQSSFDFLFVKSNGKDIEQLTRGHVSRYEFEYDSKIEEASKMIEVKTHLSHQKLPKEAYERCFDALTSPITYDPTMAGFRGDFIEKEILITMDDILNLVFVDRSLLNIKSIKGPVRENINAEETMHLNQKRRCQRGFLKFSPESATKEIIYCLKVSNGEDNNDPSKRTITVYAYDVDILVDYSESQAKMIGLVGSINIPETFRLTSISLLSTMNYLILVFRVDGNNIITGFQAWRLKQLSVGSKQWDALLIADVKDLWHQSLSVANNFVSVDGVVLERLCYVMTVNSFSANLDPLCIVFDQSKGVMVTQTKSVSLQAVLTKLMGFDAPKKGALDVMIYEPFTNHLDSGSAVVLKDLNLIVIISVDQLHSFIIKFEYDKNTKLLEAKTTLLICNPFEGYEFKRELRVGSGGVFLRLFSTLNQTFAAFYALPLLEASAELRPFKEVRDNWRNLQCLEAKQMERLPFVARDVVAVPRLGARTLRPLHQSRELSLDDDSSLLFLAADTANGLHKLVFTPKISAMSKNFLIESSSVTVRAKGIFQQAGEIKLLLQSGQIRELWVLVRYWGPLVGLCLLVVVFRLLSLKVMSKLESRRALHADSRQQRLIRTATFRQTILARGRNETFQGELLLRVKREIKGTPNYFQDEEIEADCLQADQLKEFYRRGVLAISALSSQAQEAINYDFVHELRPQLEIHRSLILR